MRRQILDAPQHHVRGRADVQAYAVLREEPHDGRRIGGGDSVLDLVELQLLDGSPDVVRRAPFADMRLETQPGVLRSPKKRLERFDRLRQFIARQIQRLIEAKGQKGREPALKRRDRAMARKTQLRDPFDRRSGRRMQSLEAARQRLGRVVKQTDRPNVLADFKTRDAIAARLDQRRLESEQASLATVEQSSDDVPRPGVHFRHRREFVVERRDIAAGSSGEETTVPAQDRMVVQVALGAAPQGVEVAVHERGLKVGDHRQSTAPPPPPTKASRPVVHPSAGASFRTLRRSRAQPAAASASEDRASQVSSAASRAVSSSPRFCARSTTLAELLAVPSVLASASSMRRSRS